MMNKEITMIDRLYADYVDIFVDNKGELWVKVDGECLLHIGHIRTSLFIDDPIHGGDECLVENECLVSNE